MLTRYLSEEQRIESFIPYPLEKEIPYYRQPDIDFDQVLKEDARKGLSVSRFAVVVEKSYNKSDGYVTDFGEILLWQIAFEAPNASSLQVMMKTKNFPEKAEIFIYSIDNKIIHGPIYLKDFFENIYCSDFIDANKIIVGIKCLKKEFQDLDFQIFSVNQGLPKKNVGSGTGLRSGCSYDVDCPEGTGWQKEIDATARMIINGAFNCSGALVNNTCQDLRPFFVTAFHCLDLNVPKWSLSESEKNISLYTFKFKFENLNPVCNGFGQGPEKISINFSGGNFRGAYPDGALLEINDNLVNQNSLALAGWNRGTTNILNTTCIHHPAGLPKKITIDYDPPGQLLGSQYDIIPDKGSVTGGSSGSGVFDNNNRIIGVFNGSSGDVCTSGHKYSSKYFENLWIGGGTNDTRFSNWLAGSNAPMTLNSIRPTTILDNGSNAVCTTNKIFSLSNINSSGNITWSVTNPNLFATSGGASTSGSSVTATLRAANNSVKGASVLTFVLSGNGCNSLFFSRNIWVGKPGLPLTSPSGTSPLEIGVSEYKTVFLLDAPGANTLTADWIASGAVHRNGSNSPSTYGTFIGDYIGTGNWAVKTQNTCGEYSNFGQFNVSSNCTYCPRIIVNNPANEILNAVIPEIVYKDIISYGGEVAGSFMLIDQQGKVIKSEKFEGYRHSTDISNYKPGIYFIKMKSDFFNLNEKVIIIK